MRKSAVIVLLVALCFVGYVFYSLIGVEPVKVADTRLVRSGDRVSVEGEVRNTGDDTGPLQGPHVDGPHLLRGALGRERGRHGAPDVVDVERGLLAPLLPRPV